MADSLSSSRSIRPTGVERTFSEREFIVSRTNPQGRITYGNRLFERISGYSPAEYLGSPHSLVRHPEMPRCVFKLLWDTISQGREIFAYVNNLAKNGDYYWVVAHVSPTFDAQGQIIGYHSNRRKPTRQAIDTISPVYALLLAEEAKHANAKAGMLAGESLLHSYLKQKGTTYERFALSL